MKHIMGMAAKGERGFTLVELVVVIAILGVLAAISVPLVNNFLDSSKAQAYNLERERIQRAVDAYRTDPFNTRFIGLRQYPIHGEAKTQPPFEMPDGDTATHRTLVITGNPLGGTKGGQPFWVDDGNGIRDPATEEDLNDEDDDPQPGWQVAPVARQNVDYIVDSRDYFINFERLIIQGLLEAVPPSASPDNQPQGSMRTFVGPYSWFVNSLGIVDSLLFAFPVPANTGYQDVFPSQKQPEGTTPPSITGNKTVNENDVYTLTLISRDPRVVPTEWDIDWGDGVQETIPGSDSTATHRYLDGPNVHTISASATDNAGTFDANVLEVQVINLDPTIASVTNSGATDEGGSANITVVASDPGPNDTLTYEFDCNSDSIFEKSQSGNIAVCVFFNSGNIQVNVRVTDGDGGTATGSTIVTVNNVAPTILFTTAPDNVSEGQTVTYIFSYNDPGNDDFTAVPTFPGCGTFGVLVGSLSKDATGGSFDCFFPDGPATTTVSMQVKDTDGDSSNALSVSVTVNNVAPIITDVTLTSPTVNEGGSTTITVAASDLGINDILRYEFDCDGIGGFEIVPQLDDFFQCSFPLVGDITVNVRVADEDGGVSDIASTTVTVTPALALYVADNSQGGSTDGEVWKYDGSNPGFLFKSLPNVNANNTGITTNNGNFWTVDRTDDVVYKYDSSFSVFAVDFNLDGNNQDPEGITVKTIVAGTFAWVVDDDDNRVYRYDLTGGTSVVPWSLDDGNVNPRGITTDGASIFVVDNDKFVYKYDMDGIPVAGGFDLIPPGGSVAGITTDGFFIWVLSTTDTQIRKFEMSGTYIPSGDIMLASENNKAEGITVLPR
ncbi:MAG: prepilin-type N-terminal cleavage/methylation domain-containing protein [Chloroflexi bacterium]|nr:prepilin-type N-terminal cleavage/methylation domain-containing protein [Chloroflexota bacterium]